MISVLVGFFTIFIGVFMVNDAKASISSIMDKARASRTSYHLETGREFYPLDDMEDSSRVHSPIDTMNNNKVF
jgi:hypothetical protein